MPMLAMIRYCRLRNDGMREGRGTPPQMPKTWVREPVSADTAEREKEPVVV